jgi:hypothetical protein
MMLSFFISFVLLETCTDGELNVLQTEQHPSFCFIAECYAVTEKQI